MTTDKLLPMPMYKQFGLIKNIQCKGHAGRA
jgi:hypothetical protein